MMPTFEVRLPTGRMPAFPDVCLVSARPRPGRRFAITTLCLRRWLQVAVLGAKPVRLDLPLTPRAALHLRLRAGLTIAAAAVALLLPLGAWIGYANHLTALTPASGLFISAAWLTAWAFAEWLFPPALDVFRCHDTLRLVFRERTLAYQTARLNEAEVCAKGR